MGLFDGSSMCMEHDRDDADEDDGKVVSLGCSIALQEGQRSPVLGFGRALFRYSFRQEPLCVLSCCFLLPSAFVFFTLSFFFSFLF